MFHKVSAKDEVYSKLVDTMRTNRYKFMVASVVAAMFFTSVISRSVYTIRNFSLVKEAQAQMGRGIMGNIMPIMMLMMLMNMMQQNKGNNLQREQSNAVKNANTNLMNADTQPNGGGANPLTNSLTNPSINPVTNPGTNPSTNPVTNPNTDPLGIFRLK